MIALILAIALEVGIDGNLAVAVARAENPALEAETIGVTRDLGIMQLNPNYIDYFQVSTMQTRFILRGEGESENDI
jgi:hypothetical protein